MLTGCAPSPYERGGIPQGPSQRDVERDYMECEYKARLANGNTFYNQSTPFPFGPALKAPSITPAPYMDSQRSTRCRIPVWRQKAIESNS